MYVELEDIKRHLNVDFNEDDNLITSMIETAEASVEKNIGAPLADIAIEGELPADLKHALRIMAASFYEYREGLTYGKIQSVVFSLSHLLAPYIQLT